ncbi:hypothetical protein EC973_007217 [Apophysomyces ossiformis]|uniref:Uncharacterized protein n=1 Tax=Apophysomyces ossiformis TaxID=679940 RepID=A0A8H7ERV8_9FUNG|nr:hypothetical protein EC973_007217 [Apophysomyces ossiformis]
MPRLSSSLATLSAYDKYKLDIHGDNFSLQEERAFVRKIDWMVMPIVCTISLLQLIDKTAVGVAAAFKYDGEFYQLMIMRCLLGLFEGSMYTSLTLLVSTLYRRKEQAARLGYIWLANGLAAAINTPIAYGITHMDNHNLSRWRWMLFIPGVITCVIGFIAFFFLLDDPKGGFLHLNAEKQIIIEERIHDNAVVRTSTINGHHIMEALKEIRLWAFVFSTMLVFLSNGPICFYSIQIYEVIGYTKYEGIQLMATASAANTVMLLLSVYLVRSALKTLYTACLMAAIGAFGMVLFIIIPENKYMLIGLCLQLTMGSIYVLILTSISNNVSGYTKKIFYNNMMGVAYTVGNFLGPFLMTPASFSAVRTGFIIYISANLLSVFLLLLARWRMAAANQYRLARPCPLGDHIEDDMTDGQNQAHIYLL